LLQMLVNRLMSVAGQHSTLERERHQASFLEALAYLGREYALLDPVLVDEETEPALFLNTVWQVQNQEEAKKSIKEFSEFLKQVEDLTKLLKLGRNLLLAAKNAKNIEVESRQVEFLCDWLEVGCSYAALHPYPKIDPDEEFSHFLNTLWTGENQESIAKSTQEVSSFFEGVKIPQLAAKGASKRLRALKTVDDSQALEASQESDFLGNVVEAGISQTFYKSIYISSAYEGTSRPTTGLTDPLAIIGQEKFISLVQEVEQGYPDDRPREVVTRIRNLYYSSDRPGFLGLLINAPNFETIWVQNPSSMVYQGGTFGSTPLSQLRVVKPVNREPQGRGVSLEAFQRLNAQADENAKGDNPSPYIVFPNHQVVDIGHLLLTLDALLHPGSAPPYPHYDVPTIDPASWVADISIASVWVYYHQRVGSPSPQAPQNITLSNPPTPRELDLYYRASAPAADLIADADGFGLFNDWQDDQPLSSLLRRYYLGGSQQSSPGVYKRWLTFCKLNRFVTTEGGVTWRSREDLLEEIVVRVNNFGDLFSDGGNNAIANDISGIRNYRDFQYTPYMINKFLDYVKNNLRLEMGS
jgi:hypothetical protein